MHIQASLKSMERKSDIFGTLRNPWIYSRAISEPWVIYNRRHFQKPFEHVRWRCISEPYHSQSSSLKHCQEYLGIFRDIDVYSAIYTGAQLGREERHPLMFLKIGKRCLDFLKKGHHYVHYWLSSPFKMYI